MSDQPATPCECHPTEFPFVCPRHRCRKTAHWHMLCRERMTYFELWEQGGGPGQPIPGQTISGQPLPGEGTQGNGAGPRLAQQAWSLASSVAAFVADGCRTIPQEAF